MFRRKKKVDKSPRDDGTLNISAQSLTKVRGIITRAIPDYRSHLDRMLASPLNFGSGPQPIPEFHESLEKAFREHLGKELTKKYSYYGTDDLLQQMDSNDLIVAARVLSTILHSLDSNGNPHLRWENGAHFDGAINSIFENECVSIRMEKGAIKEAAENMITALRIALLEDTDDIADHKSGDVQEEMVSSTVQARLSKPGTILIDYGAGLGRVLRSLSTAQHFGHCRYVCVESPHTREIEEVANSAGAELLEREVYLASPIAADVIMMVNVLHHIPFADIPRQLNVLLNSLRPDGTIIIHEMGELRTPEKKNVPWLSVDITNLLQFNGIFVNPRSTTSKSGVPISHTIISVQSVTDFTPSLITQTRSIWKQMKERVLKEIDSIYKCNDKSDQIRLQHLLIINANLDLNRPQ